MRAAEFESQRLGDITIVPNDRCCIIESLISKGLDLRNSGNRGYAVC